MFDRNGNLTDDADRMVYGCETFESDPTPDFDGMEYDDAHSDFKCGRRGRFGDIVPCCCDDEGKFVGPGCRHCNPVDHECKPYQFGIETFDDCYAEARQWARQLWGALRVHTDAERRALFIQFATADGYSARRDRHSDIVWDRLCDECETHTEAVAKYERWAKRAMKTRYRG